MSGPALSTYHHLYFWKMSETTNGLVIYCPVFYELTFDRSNN